MFPAATCLSIKRLISLAMESGLYCIMESTLSTEEPPYNLLNIKILRIVIMTKNMYFIQPPKQVVHIAHRLDTRLSKISQYNSSLRCATDA